MIRTALIMLSAVVIVIPPPVPPPPRSLAPASNPLRSIVERRLRAVAGTESPVRLPLTFLPARSTPLVVLRIVFRCGSQDDLPGKEGLAALTAAIVATRETLSFTAAQIAERLYPLSAGLSADCHKEVTVFTGQVHRETFTKFLPLVVSIVSIPRFRQDELDRVKDEAIRNLRSSRHDMSDAERAARGLEIALYHGHPYGHADAGTVAGLRAITLDDVQRFHRTHYTRDALLIGLAGSADEATIDLVRGQISRLPSATFENRPLPDPEPVRGIDVTLVETPCDTAAIAVGFPLRVSFRDDDFYALAVARAYLDEPCALGGDAASGREERDRLIDGELAHAVAPLRNSSPIFSAPDDPRRQQAFSIRLGRVPHEQVAFALRSVLWELDHLARDGLTEDQFSATRERLLNASKFWGRTLSQRLGLSMEGALHECNDVVTELDRRLPRLSTAKVNAAFRRHLAPPGIKVIAVTRDARGLGTALLSPTPAPPGRSTPGPIQPGAGREQAIAAFPLRDVHVEVVPPGRPFPFEP
jgi:zinc protease